MAPVAVAAAGLATAAIVGIVIASVVVAVGLLGAAGAAYRVSVRLSLTEKREIYANVLILAAT